MRVIKPSRLASYWMIHPKARSPLERWLHVAEEAEWNAFNDVRIIFASADQVKVASGKAVVVFDIGGNSFRLICAIHYDRRKIFVLRFMTHAEYDKDKWKEDL